MIFFEKTIRYTAPLSAYISVAFFLCVPLVIPDATLLYHEPMRAEVFKAAALIWIVGFVVSVSLMLARVAIAYGMIRKYAVCRTERVISVYGECLGMVKVRHSPPLLYGTIKEPACVISTWRPYVILREEIIRELTDEELRTVLTHELLHVKRKHTLLQRAFDIICCVHWFNPIVWIDRHEFSSACEIDCDRSVLKVFGGRLQAIGYAKIMLKLMELSVAKRKSPHGALGALDYWVAKHRITNLVNAPSKLKKVIAALACVVIVGGMVWFSVTLSRSYFYPFGGSDIATEWSESR
jgi:bla regulator protein BlaR1